MDAGLIGLGAGLGAGLAVMGGGAGIGRLTAAAVESIARQPEAAGDIRGSMIIMAAFIEGVTMFAILTCLLVGFLNAANPAELLQVAEDIRIAGLAAAAGG